jgi:hypothetical protein
MRAAIMAVADIVGFVLALAVVVMDVSHETSSAF